MTEKHEAQAIKIAPLDISFFQDFCRKHALAVNDLTERQLAESFRQALVAGDFVRLVVKDTGGQTVTYLPFQEVEHYRTLYYDLIMQVASKYPEESRHETARRYIKEAEERKVGGSVCENNGCDIATPSGIVPA